MKGVSNTATINLMIYVVMINSPIVAAGKIPQKAIMVKSVESINCDTIVLILFLTHNLEVCFFNQLKI